MLNFYRGDVLFRRRFVTGDVLLRRRFVTEMFGRETFCRGDVLYSMCAQQIRLQLTVHSKLIFVLSPLLYKTFRKLIQQKSLRNEKKIPGKKYGSNSWKLDLCICQFIAKLIKKCIVCTFMENYLSFIWVSVLHDCSKVYWPVDLRHPLRQFANAHLANMDVNRWAHNHNSVNINKLNSGNYNSAHPIN
jgi:hypothetical protein